MQTSLGRLLRGGSGGNSVCPGGVASLWHCCRCVWPVNEPRKGGVHEVAEEEQGDWEIRCPFRPCPIIVVSVQNPQVSLPQCAPASWLQGGGRCPCPLTSPGQACTCPFQLRAAGLPATSVVTAWLVWEGAWLCALVSHGARPSDSPGGRRARDVTGQKHFHPSSVFLCSSVFPFYLTKC